MLAMQKELLIEFADLEALDIECNGCHSHIRMRVGSELRQDYGLVQCSVCGTRFDITLSQNIKQLLTLIRRIPESTTISFQVSQDAKVSQDAIPSKQ